MNRLLCLTDKRLLFITILITCFMQSTRQDANFFDKTDKSLGKCVDEQCKCFASCFNQHKEDINSGKVSINCYSIDNYKQIENAMTTIAKNNKTFCDKNVTKLIINKVNIIRSDSNATIESIQFLEKSVQVLNISQTFSAQLPNNLFSHLIHLSHLNLSNNNLTQFDSDALLSPNNRLISLDLSYNQLNSIDLTNLNSLEILLISNNRLETIKEFDIFKRNHKLKSLMIGNNEWNCDDKLIWLLNYSINSNDLISDSDQSRCSQPETVKEMPFSQRLSVLQTPICSQCECLLLRSKDAISVNCTNKQLNSLPSNLPSVTKKVILNNNNIKNLSLDSASNWQNVTYLYLSNNTIESFVGLEGTKLLKNLVALNMTYNRLREIPRHILDQLLHLDELYLSENPWHCDCNTVIFKDWLQQHFKTVKDIYNIRCAASLDSHIKPKNGLHSGQQSYKFSNRELLKILKSELCPQPGEPIPVFDIINWLLAILILIIVVKLIYDYFWQKRTGKLPRFFKLNLN